MVTSGRISDVVGLTIEATGPAMQIGDICYVEPVGAAPPVAVEVVGFRKDRILLMPLGGMRGIGPGCRVRPTHAPHTTGVGPGLIGRVIGSNGSLTGFGGGLPTKEFLLRLEGALPGTLL